MHMIMDVVKALLIDPINNNKLFWGVSMLIVNLGSRHIVNDLGQVHEAIFSSPYFKPIIFMCIFFMATRDILTSLLLTFVCLIVLMGFLNEKSKYCLFKNVKPKVKPDEYLRAKSTVEEYERQNKESEKLNKAKADGNSEKHESPYAMYLQTSEKLFSKGNK
jgi:hypothetical protein